MNHQSRLNYDMQPSKKPRVFMQKWAHHVQRGRYTITQLLHLHTYAFSLDVERVRVNAMLASSCTLLLFLLLSLSGKSIVFWSNAFYNFLRRYWENKVRYSLIFDRFNNEECVQLIEVFCLCLAI